jgi:hypothetical protein
MLCTARFGLTFRAIVKSETSINLDLRRRKLIDDAHFPVTLTTYFQTLHMHLLFPAYDRSVLLR